MRSVASRVVVAEVGGRHVRELAIAERVLERATTTLERTRQQTGPDFERYRAAVVNVEDALIDLGHHDLASQLDPVDRRVRGLARVEAALDTWQRWASGDTITVEKLRNTVRILTGASGSDRWEHHRALGQVIQTWASTAGLDLHLADRPPPSVEPAGPELGL